LHNINAEVAEKDVNEFFHELQEGIVGMELQGDKGEGQVEFKDRETLVR
jgi:hypothetical protein